MTSRNGQKGNTLLEVLIGMSLLVSGVLAYFQLDAKLIKENKHAISKSEAIQLLQQKLDTLAITGIAGSGTESVQINNNAYSLDWTVSISNGIKIINTHAFWADLNGLPSDQTTITLSGHFLPQNRTSLAMLPPPTPLMPN